MIDQIVLCACFFSSQQWMLIIRLIGIRLFAISMKIFNSYNEIEVILAELWIVAKRFRNFLKDFQILQYNLGTLLSLSIYFCPGLYLRPFIRRATMSLSWKEFLLGFKILIFVFLNSLKQTESLCHTRLLITSIIQMMMIWLNYIFDKKNPCI